MIIFTSKENSSNIKINSIPPRIHNHDQFLPKDNVHVVQFLLVLHPHRCDLKGENIKSQWF